MLQIELYCTDAELKGFQLESRPNPLKAFADPIRLMNKLNDKGQTFCIGINIEITKPGELLEL